MNTISSSAWPTPWVRWYLRQLQWTTCLRKYSRHSNTALSTGEEFTISIIAIWHRLTSYNLGQKVTYLLRSKILRQYIYVLCYRLLWFRPESLPTRKTFSSFTTRQSRNIQWTVFTSSSGATLSPASSMCSCPQFQSCWHLSSGIWDRIINI